MDKRQLAEYGFSKEMEKALYNLGYETLTEVQDRVIPLVLIGKDIIVKSQTGSGKTAAFAIPLCEKIALEQKTPQVLVLTPTRELAVQIKQDIGSIGRYKRIRCAALYGQQPIEVQTRELKQRVHCIVGTPGRTFDHMERNNINLADIKYFIIDEADKMLDMGFIEQVEAISKLLPKDKVTMVFSATMPEKVQHICNQYMIRPIVVEVDPGSEEDGNIKQCYYEVEENQKSNLLQNLIYRFVPESGIVFCNTREKVDSLSAELEGEGFHCGKLHGGMEQRDRLRSIESFKRGEFSFLIATDVVARGIHIDEVALVVNYDFPLDRESYVHRIGRTGRAGNSGTAITLLTLEEADKLADIEDYVHYKIPQGELPTKEEVAKGQAIFAKERASKPILKADKNAALNQEITRIRISAGKKNKMRPGDILGAISSIPGLGGEDIGVIDIQATCSYVEILSSKGQAVLDALSDTKIKGKIYSAKKISIGNL